jgi:transcriptional regulator with XRE-family HTH domain
MPGLPPDQKVRLLGRTVRRIRRERDLSQEAVAAAAGVHPNQVGRLERGDSDVYCSTLLRVVDGLGVPLSDVVRAYEQQLGRHE